MTIEPHPRQAELDALAEDLSRRGFGEGDEFFVQGHLEEVFLGVIASAQEVGGAQDSGAGGVVERLRQVRAR